MTTISPHDFPPATYVSATWLAQHIDDADLIVLDATIDREAKPDGGGLYRDGHALFVNDGHLPHARFADLFKAFSDPLAKYPFTKPARDALQAVLRALGVTTRSTIVVYDRLNGVWAARVWWVLRAFGLTDVAVLDGGMRHWVRQGGALEFGVAPIAPAGDVVLRETPGYLVDLAQMKAVVDGERDAKSFCALRHRDFTGEGSDDPRRGHIPGSRSLPFADLLDENGLFEPARLRVQIDAHGIRNEDTLVLYCGGGVAACGLALGLVALGFDAKRLSVYDGSLSEWRADPTLPVVVGE
ncbi:sulfurtransferase [Pararobbsia silviterrae]|uniref:Sulfurtransferase n=1 Tax=Pararobbsia silviterrae TaxID=1792498 RepID=A0A494X8N3_9BURK|nr:sulfurtransferase [Pararobbsia silviterrae]RKP47075.1 sulfurtransferase [Pararobbsia silviterrae]